MALSEQEQVLLKEFFDKTPYSKAEDFLISPLPFTKQAVIRLAHPELPDPLTGQQGVEVRNLFRVSDAEMQDFYNVFGTSPPQSLDLPSLLRMLQGKPLYTQISESPVTVAQKNAWKKAKELGATQEGHALHVAAKRGGEESRLKLYETLLGRAGETVEGGLSGLGIGKYYRFAPLLLLAGLLPWLLGKKKEQEATA